MEHGSGAPTPATTDGGAKSTSDTADDGSTRHTVGLSLAIFGGASLSGFAWMMLFGIIVGTSSSIFIAAPILLFLGENKLRRDAQAPPPTTAKARA